MSNDSEVSAFFRHILTSQDRSVDVVMSQMHRGNGWGISFKITVAWLSGFFFPFLQTLSSFF